MSGDSDEERRAFELMQQLNNQLSYGNKRDGSGCQKPFNLEGVDFNVASRCKVILDLLKSELLLENIK